MRRNILSIIASLIVILSGAASAVSGEYVSRSFYIMGTDLNFRLVCNDTDLCERVIQEALNEVSRLDLIFSNYRSDSELSRILGSDRKYPVAVSRDFYSLTAISVFVNLLSGGAFDITAGSIVDKWKSAEINGHEPDISDIKHLLAKCVGTGKIRLISDLSIKINSDCVELDYGAIGKGYALDKISGVMNKHGIRDGIINFGGNILAKGKNIKGDNWDVTLKVPPSLKGKVKLNDIHISDLSASTSGGYERYFEINNIQYSHIADPRTGYPVDVVKSVTVVSSDPTVGDALSTAFSVMDLEEVKKLLSVLDNLGVLIVSDNIRYENDYFKHLYIN